LKCENTECRMRKRFLLEGDYREKPIWIGITFKEEATSVMLYLFLKENMKKEVLQAWLKGSGELPEALETLERTIADENLLSEDIKVLNVGKVRDIEIEWADNLMLTRMIQGFEGDLALLKDKVAVLEDYSQEVFDDCAGFWNRVLSFKKDNSSFSHAIIDVYKADLDILFEALKALRKDHKKELQEKSGEAMKELLLKLEILNDKLEAKPNFKFTIERLKDIRTELNTSGLRQKDYADIDGKINALFEKMSGAKSKVNHEKVDKRIGDLEGIVGKMQKSIDWENREIAKEEKNKEFASMAFQVQLLDAKIDLMKKSRAEKEEKLADVKTTLASLNKKSK
jgi:hypothetical protein